MDTKPRIMVLDAEYTHSVSVLRELKQHLSATTMSVAWATNAPGHRSIHSDIKLFVPKPTEAEFGPALLQLIQQNPIDVLIPVGFDSHKAVIALRESLPQNVQTLLPNKEQFELATDKIKTYELASSLGIRAPKQLFANPTTDEITASTITYPVFVKSRQERGGESTALVRSKDELLAFNPDSLGGDIIVQEYISGSEVTYAHCGYFRDGIPHLSYQHAEVLSVPRRGGSASRAAVVTDHMVSAAGNELMSNLGWTGFAQIEFKKDALGEPVLMEINPKLWASYALADMSDHPIVSTGIKELLGNSQTETPRHTRPSTDVIFPFRELSFLRKNWRSVNVMKSAFSMVWPPASSDFELRDIKAYIPRRLK